MLLNYHEINEFAQEHVARLRQEGMKMAPVFKQDSS